MEPAYVGLGGNVGEVAAQILHAAEALEALPWVRGVRLSSLWRSAPVGPVADQPWFVNAVAGLDLDANVPAPAPTELLAALLAIEARAGRRRDREVAQGPRRLDLDLLLWGDRRLDLPGPPRLRLPHPRLIGRAFALAPLVELAGRELVIPGAGLAGPLLDRALGDPAQAVAKIV
jgi:2-amino-4-hydroxy-6-hydroxymethyldihydropteridine diphosphokinase